MHLTAYTPASFFPERSYAIRTLFSHFLGIPVEIKAVEDRDRYCIECPKGRLYFQDVFFKPSVDSLQSAYNDMQSAENMLSNSGVLSTINKQLSTTTIKDQDVISFFGSGDIEEEGGDTHLFLDIIGSTFFMLTRLEELWGDDRDEHDRFRAGNSILGKAGLLLRPVVDEYCALLKRLLLGQGVPEAMFKQENFKVNCTCDLDYPWYYNSRLHILRHLARAVVSRNHPRNFMEELRMANAYWHDPGSDPFLKMDYIMDQAEKASQTCTFYIMSGSNHTLDPPLYLGYPRYQNMIERIISRGHALGFHPSYTTPETPERLFAEWDVLKSFVPAVERYCRQHYLRFRNPASWQAQAECGMEIDSTLGFADAAGFRCGTSKAFPVFDLENREELPLLEQPLLLMDVTLNHYCKYSPEEALNVAETLIHQVKQYQGTLTFLWHNSSFAGEGWEGYKLVFKKLLNA